MKELEVNKLNITVYETEKKDLIGVLRYIADMIENDETSGKLLYKRNVNLFRYGAYQFNLEKVKLKK